MNRLDNLIHEFCPHGVVHTRIADISTVLRGKRLTKNELTIAGAFPVFHGGLEPLGFYSQKNREADTTMVINVGASAGTVGFCERDFWSSDGCFCISHSEHALSKYVYYVLVNQQSFLMSKVRKAGIPTLDAKVVENLQIPLPPLAVQQEIVRILDSFTELTAELTEKLTAELTARRKQYEHYRDELLTFGPEVEWKTIGEVCKLSAGGDVPKERFSKNKTEEYTVPILSNGIGENALYGFTDIAKIKAPCVTVAARGTIGYCELRNEDFYPVVRLICACPKEDLLPAYLKYYLETITFQVPTSGIPQLTVPMLSKYKIPIPTLAEQGHIVAILDKFSAICNDLTSGLPAEITARQKQYEYYRDKLLTFKELDT